MTGNQDSILSIEAAASRPSTEVIALGKQLSTELGLDRSCKTLSKWLAQLLAEKIVAAETATDLQQKQKSEHEAVELILRIWQQRYSVPPCARPFGRLERAIEFLASLHDRETDRFAAFRAMKEENNAWEQLILAIETFRSDAVPLLALSQVAVERGDNLLEWEQKHRAMLEELETSGIDLIRRWLGAIDEDPIGDPNLPAADGKRLSIVLSKVEKSLQRLQAAVESFKAEVADN